MMDPKDAKNAKAMRRENRPRAPKTLVAVAMIPIFDGTFDKCGWIGHLVNCEEIFKVFPRPWQTPKDGLGIMDAEGKIIFAPNINVSPDDIRIIARMLVYLANYALEQKDVYCSVWRDERGKRRRRMAPIQPYLENE